MPEHTTESDHVCEPGHIHTFKFEVEVGLNFNDGNWSGPLEETILKNRENIHQTIVQNVEFEYGRDFIPWLTVVLKEEICEVLPNTNAGE